MSLWFTVHINVERLGLVEVRRLEHLDLTDQSAIQDAVSTYDVRLNGALMGTVRHRYGDGDGAFRLTSLATDLIARHDDPAARRPLRGYVMRDYEQFMATLAASRESQDIPKTTVARRMGCLRGQVARWLAGEVEAHGRSVFDLADALGYDVALVPREPHPNQAQEAA